MEDQRKEKESNADADNGEEEIDSDGDRNETSLLSAIKTRRRSTELGSLSRRVASNVAACRRRFCQMKELRRRSSRISAALHLPSETIHQFFNPHLHT
jgi:hypothetical protein